MKFSISQSDLLDSLKSASRAVSGQNTLPVLGNILIRAEGKKVHFSATNLEISISTSVEAVVANEGGITVPSKVLTAYVSLLGKDEDITVHATETQTLSIKTKSSSTKIKGISAEEFPNQKGISGGRAFEIDAKGFRKGTHLVGFSAQENSSRPILTGVYFGIKDKELKMAATDSYRLSEHKITLEREVENYECVVPVRAMLEAERIAAKSEKILVTLGENEISFEAEGIKLISRLIDGKFPDYEQIIPKAAETTVKIPRETLEMAVRRVSIFAKENNYHMKLKVSTDGKLEVLTDSTEIGEEITSLDVQVTGKENTIALNTDYMADALSALNSEEEVVLELQNPTTPAVIKTEKIPNFVHLIMPLK